MKKLLAILMLAVPAFAVHADDIGIPCDPGASTTEMNVGDIFECSIESVGDSDVYTFAGAAGDKMLVTLSDVGNGGASMVCEIYHGGGLLTTLSATNTGIVEELMLVDSADYTILCFENGNNSTDAYNLALQRRSPLPPENQIIGNDSVIEAQTISPVADSDVFSFSGAAGDTQILTFSDIGNGGASMVAEVFDPNMQLFTILNTTNTGTEQALALIDSGSYTVMVTENGNNSTDTYNIALQQLFPGTPASVPLLYDVSTGNQDISPVSDSDMYIFSGTAGDSIILTLSDVGNGGASLIADVFDPNMQPFAELNAVNTGADTGVVVLVDSGTYTVRVREDGNNSTDTYTLNLQCLGGTCVNDPDISASPAFFNFGEVPIGTSSASAVFTVMNDGDGNLNNIAVSSPNSVFSIDSDTCTGAIVLPGDTCSFGVIFTPVASGRVITRLSIASNDPATPVLNLTVVGTGVGGGNGGVIGGSVFGVGVQTVICTNRTTGQTVRITDRLSDWDCGLQGLDVSPGDRVQINVSGSAE